MAGVPKAVHGEFMRESPVDVSPKGAGPVPLVKPELREESRLCAADAVFWREQIVPHLVRIQDGVFSAGNLHVSV